MTDAVAPAPSTGRLITAAAMGAIGALHFVAPKNFDGLIPKALGNPRIWTYGSGLAELAAGALLARRSTSKVGALWLLIVFVGVWPGNWKAAIDGGMGASPPFDSAGVAWARVPLQLPMIWWAYHLYKRAQVDPAL